MPILRTLLFSLALYIIMCPAWGQQQKVDLRSDSPFAFKEFREAKVLQPFGRFTRATANILLKTGMLCYIDGDKIMQADASRLLGVTFGDSIRYVRLDTHQMARVVAQKGYNSLLRLTTIDLKKLKAETEGGDNLPFLEITDAGAFVELNGEGFEYGKGLPLKEEFFFSICGTIIPANQTRFKTFVLPERKTDFKALMNDHFWSWGDEASLTRLLDFLPQR